MQQHAATSTNKELMPGHHLGCHVLHQLACLYHSIEAAEDPFLDLVQAGVECQGAPTVHKADGKHGRGHWAVEVTTP
jgi:hypothetical protein